MNRFPDEVAEHAMDSVTFMQEAVGLELEEIQRVKEQNESK